MKIQRIQNFTYNTHFKGAATPNYQQNITGNNDKKPSENKPIPEWVRKGMLALLIFFAVKNDPYVENLTKPETDKWEEKARNEYFEDVSKLGKNDDLAPAMYHLNRLADVDNIKIQTNGIDGYRLTIPFDNQTINTQISLIPAAKNTIVGSIKNKDGETIRYKAIFSEKKPDEFQIKMRNKNNDSYTFGRTPKGEFYQVKNNKKVILNKKNVENYQKFIENLPTFKEKQDFKFFTNENDMWRKLNLILLSFLLFAEMAHDNNRRKNKKD